MISSPLLQKTRQINNIVQNLAGQSISFPEMAKGLTKVIQSNIYIVNQTGYILGYSFLADFECDLMVNNVLKRGCFPPEYNHFLQKKQSSQPNLYQIKNECIFVESESCLFANKIITVAPIIGGGKRLGTLILARFNNLFDADDLILAETSATMVGMEIYREEIEIYEKEIRDKEVAQLAIETLSYSELEVMFKIFKELKGAEGILITSKIADRLGITRSVIVNALGKLISAGLIESRSLGMKGTYIHALNPYLLACLGKKVNSL